MSKKKVNPRRHIITEADLNRAVAIERDNAIQNTLYIALYVLMNKFDFDSDMVAEFAGEFNYTADSIAKGYLNKHDIMQALKDEQGLFVNWRAKND